MSTVSYAPMTHGRAVRYRLEDADRNKYLELPDGRPASQVRRTDLVATLRRFAIPDIADSMSKNQMLDRYRSRLESVCTELYPYDAASPSQVKLREAAQFIGRQER